MRVALAQIDCLLGDLDHNVAKIKGLMVQQRDAGADLIVFPELILTGYSLGRIGHEVWLNADGPNITALAEEANGISAVVGFHEGGTGPRSFNSAAFLEAGSLLHLHRKLYLPTYGAFEERKHFSPGQTMRAFDSRLGRMAVLICNDAWQPSLPFLAVQDGAEVLLVPVNSALDESPGVLDIQQQWKEITRFYAVMFQCYVVLVNRVGTEGDLCFWGGSHVMDPSGRTVAAAGPEETVLTVDLDLGAVRRRRWQLPLVKEARLALLERELGRLISEGGDL
ncbi:MAG: amidohydrolase [Actinobacteria bacterium]|nr:amidohydrolase [Actinomycetota bacterium]